MIMNKRICSSGHKQGGKGEGIFHGHSDNDSESKKELIRYFRSIDKGLLTMLHDSQKTPARIMLS
jgi:hypothetical protein